MQCFSYLRNIQDLFSDGKIPNERPFGVPFNGPVIPFGATSNITLFVRKTYRDYINLVQKSCQVFHVLYPGGIWKGDISQTLNFHTRKLNAREVLTPQRSGNFVFPIADGTVEIFRGEQRLRTSTLTPERKFFEESQMNYILQTHFLTTQRGMTRKLKMTSGPSQEISRGTIGSSVLDHDFGHFVFWEKYPKYLDIVTLEFSIILDHLPF